MVSSAGEYIGGMASPLLLETIFRHLTCLSKLKFSIIWFCSIFKTHFYRCQDKSYISMKNKSYLLISIHIICLKSNLFKFQSKWLAIYFHLRLCTRGYHFYLAVLLQRPKVKNQKLCKIHLHINYTFLLHNSVSYISRKNPYPYRSNKKEKLNQLNDNVKSYGTSNETEKEQVIHNYCNVQ